jgi:hypothetical protein
MFGQGNHSGALKAGEISWEARASTQGITTLPEWGENMVTYPNLGIQYSISSVVPR